MEFFCTKRTTDEPPEGTPRPKIRRSIAKKSPDASNITCATHPAFAFHRRPVDNIEEWVEDYNDTTDFIRQSDLNVRPRASTFKLLSQLTIYDSTFGYNPVTGVRRIQVGTHAQSTRPISVETIHNWRRENRETLTYLETVTIHRNLVSRMTEIWESERPAAYRAELPQIKIDGGPNELYAYRHSWDEMRLVVNTHPIHRTTKQTHLYAIYSKARRETKGIKIPPCNAGAIPTTIREDEDRTLIGEDIWTHWMTKQICGTSKKDKSRVLRQHLISLFKGGGIMWLQMPANGLKMSAGNLPYTLQERIWKAQVYTGNCKGEDSLLNFARHLGQHVQINTADIPRFSEWASRILSGQVFNKDFRSKPDGRANRSKSHVSEVVEENGKPEHQNQDTSDTLKCVPIIKLAARSKGPQNPAGTIKGTEVLGPKQQFIGVQDYKNESSDTEQTEDGEVLEQRSSIVKQDAANYEFEPYF